VVRDALCSGVTLLEKEAAMRVSVAFVLLLVLVLFPASAAQAQQERPECLGGKAQGKITGVLSMRESDDTPGFMIFSIREDTHIARFVLAADGGDAKEVHQAIEGKETVELSWIRATEATVDGFDAPVTLLLIPVLMVGWPDHPRCLMAQGILLSIALHPNV
jgi:hypothetical protein